MITTLGGGEVPGGDPGARPACLTNRTRPKLSW